MLRYLTYFQIFGNFFVVFILLFMPGLLSYRQFAVVTGGFSVLAIVYYFVKKKNIRFYMFSFLIMFLVILGAYYYTSILYGFTDLKYNSFLFVLAGQILPTSLCAIIVAHMPGIAQQIKKLVPLVSMIFFILSFVSTFYHDAQTSGGFIDNEEGLDYQNISYVAAYSAALAGYYILCGDRIKWTVFFNNRLSRILISPILYLSLIIILITGGRGGLMIYLAEMLLFAFLMYKKYSKKNNRVVFFVLVLLTMFLLIPMAINYVSTSTIDNSGFVRITAFLMENDQSDRDVLRAVAFKSIAQSPVCGHGIGSVFYEVGHYSHNSFIDSLVEGGCIGFFIFSSLIMSTFIRAYYLIKADVTNYLWLLIFLGSFVLSMASSYYLAHLPMWWSVVYMFFYSKNLKNTKVI